MSGETRTTIRAFFSLPGCCIDGFVEFGSDQFCPFLYKLVSLCLAVLLSFLRSVFIMVVLAAFKIGHWGF